MDMGTALVIAAGVPVVNQWITSFMHHRSEKRDLVRSQKIAAKAEEVAMDTRTKVEAVHETLLKMNGNAEQHKDDPRY